MEGLQYKQKIKIHRCIIFIALQLKVVSVLPEY